MWTGDLDGMVERGVIRALVPYSRTFFFLDGARPRGFAYEHLSGLEASINRRLGRSTLKVPIVFLPTPRNELVPSLVAGRGDIAAGNLTVTEERLEEVDFSAPLTTGVSELVVSGPDSPQLQTLQDLSGEKVFVRHSSSYHGSLENLNEELEEADLEPVEIIPVSEFFEDADLLEMVHAGLIGTTVVDSHKVALWRDLLDDLVVHEDLALSRDREIAWAMRRNSPRLAGAVNDYVRRNRTGTRIGNILFNRYFHDNRWVRDANDEEDLAHLGELAGLFEHYARRYEVDPLLVAALAYQESGLDHSQVSAAGAVGIMQVRPATARDPQVGIDDVTDLEDNIHAGIRYFSLLRERYFSDGEIEERDRTLLALAAYNAGPARIARLRKKAEAMGLDPNRWSQNVEVAAAREIGRETVQYVSNVMKYHLAYTLSSYGLEARRALRGG